jgi:hypothetical protein
MAFLVAPGLAAGLIFIIGAGSSLRAGTDGIVADEYQIKAAFLYSFTKFVEWPSQAFQSADEPVAICVLGENPFGSALEQAVRGKTFGNRRFVIREISTARQASTCHILFVSTSEKRRLASIFAELKGYGTLTVGETDGFVGSGGVINFKLKDSRVRLEIDRSAAVQANLRISSKLLSLAEDARK